MRSPERMAVSAAFLIHSTVSGTWAPRLPAIKSSLELSDGELGTALVGLAIGLLAGTRVAGAQVDRFGSRPVMRVGFPILCATLLLPALAGSLPTLFLALLALGLMSGFLDVAMNAQGIEVERHLGRPLLNGLHGLWSVGLGIGAGGAALAAAAGLDPLEHFAIVAAVLTAASLVSMARLLPTPPHRISEAAEVGRVPWTPALALLGTIAFCSFAGEGAASDWSAVYLAQELSASAGLAAVAFAAFATTMAISRFAADSLRARIGPAALVRGGALLAASGLLLGLLVHEPAAAIASFAVLGFGLAPIVPTAFGAAGDLDHRATGRLVGHVATVGYVGTVVGPIVIGWVAQATSLRAALGVVVVLALVIAGAAGAAAPTAAGARAPRRSAPAQPPLRP